LLVSKLARESCYGGDEMFVEGYGPYTNDRITLVHFRPRLYYVKTT